jgi:hypothetical protein
MAPAEPADAPPTAAEADAIAMQVDQDLDGLTNAASDERAHDIAAAPRDELVDANPRADDPAEFLLDTPTQNVPPPVPASAQVSNTQFSNAQLSSALVAIETELLAGAKPSDMRSNSPASTPTHAAPTKSLSPPVAGGPLAALSAMSEEERIALFS